MRIKNLLVLIWFLWLSGSILGADGKEVFTVKDWEITKLTRGSDTITQLVTNQPITRRADQEQSFKFVITIINKKIRVLGIVLNIPLSREGYSVRVRWNDHLKENMEVWRIRNPDTGLIETMDAKTFSDKINYNRALVVIDYDRPGDTEKRQKSREQLKIDLRNLADALSFVELEQ